MAPDQKQLVAGQRFRMSKLGAKRCPRLSGKVGEIVRVRENLASVIVQFDNNRNTTTIHKDYIEPM